MKNGRIGTVSLGELFQLRKEPGVAGLPILSVTMNDGLVHRDTLDRKADGKLTPDEHLLIRKEDLAYNMMRMWQGASGLAKQDGIISPAYVVVIPSDSVDPTFASYWFKSARMTHLFWAYSYGITGDRLRLYYKDFAGIPVIVPPKNDQIQVGRTLAAADRAIALTEDLIAAKQKLKGELAERLLTGKLKIELFDGNACWGKRDFRELFVVADRKRRNLPQGRYLSAGRYPVVDQGELLVAGYSDDASLVISDVPLIVFGDHTRRVKFIDFSFVCGADGTQLLQTTDSLDIEFGYQLLKNFSLPSLGYSRHMRLLKEQAFRVPEELSVQRRIVATLRSADRQVELLKRKLAAQRQLKKGLMQKLLSGELSVNTG